MRPAVLLALPLLASCAVGLTPAQEVSWDAYKACQMEGPSTKLERVSPDGGWHIRGREGEVFKVDNCMRGYWRKASLEGRIPATPPVLTVTPAASRPDTFVVEQAPVWSPGDEWRFSTSSTAGRKTTYTWRVDREETVAGVPYYVIKSRTRDIFHRKSDLAFSHDTVNGELSTRNTPPRVEYVWPLAIGAIWAQTFRFERPSAGRSYDTSSVTTVDAEERVTVPAGTFRTLRIVHRDKANKTVRWEEWYAPEVRMWVKMHEPALEEGARTRELLSYKTAAMPSIISLTNPTRR
jgi:hypothetical protein